MCVWLPMCMRFWFYDSLNIPGLSEQLKLKYATNWLCSICFNNTPLHMKSPRKTRFFRGRGVFGIYTGLLSWCVTMPVSPKNTPVSLFFAFSCFLGENCSFSPVATTVEYFTVTLDSFRVWHYLQSWMPVPLFSRLFREPVISQMLKEMTISEGGGWKSEKFLNTAILAQP